MPSNACRAQVLVVNLVSKGLSIGLELDNNWSYIGSSNLFSNRSHARRRS
ncbi:hypothetical protein CHELA41_50310 [Hyphomicrobiales bacterium]|nr:hypothetical protein CHELA41_50310 [Hyphomicrobiales bacterium]